MNAILLGAIAAFPSYIALQIRAKTSLDDSLDVLAAHGVAEAAHGTELGIADAFVGGHELLEPCEISRIRQISCDDLDLSAVLVLYFLRKCHETVGSASN